MMGIPGIPSPPQQPRLYSQQLQLKLYQAFIFSIPILFSIILLLLFYLYYLKKRASSLSASSSHQTPPQSSNGAALVDSHSAWGFKETVNLKLPVILFDENSRARETLCCVCLGEFMVKEELHQLPACHHFFHINCIRLWLHSNSTCPLCRCSLLPITTINNTNRHSEQNVLPNGVVVLGTQV